MRAKPLILIFTAFCVAFGIGLWWFQTRAYYERTADRSEILVQGQTFVVSAYDGIDAPTSPLKLRACFRAHDAMAVDALSIFPEAEEASPLVAPGWFDCFDAEAIQQGIDARRIRPVVANSNVPWGFDRIVALGRDGRGWIWRQINACGRAKFEGDEPPAGCPPAP